MVGVGVEGILPEDATGAAAFAGALTGVLAVVLEDILGKYSRLLPVYQYNRGWKMKSEETGQCGIMNGQPGGPSKEWADSEASAQVIQREEDGGQRVMRERGGIFGEVGYEPIKVAQSKLTRALHLSA